MIRNYIKVVMAVFVALLLTVPASAQVKVGTSSMEMASTIKINGSPIANGMGSGSVNNIDQYAAFSNPGALAIHQLENNFYFVAPLRNRWRPDFPADLSISLISFGGSINYRQLWNKPDSKFNAGFGAAWSRYKFKYNDFVITTVEYPEGAYTVDMYDKASFITFTGSVEYYIRLGIGYSYKKLTSFGSLKMNAHDYGIYADYPITRLLMTDAGNYINIRPSVSYYRGNIGKSEYYGLARPGMPAPKISAPGVENWGVALTLVSANEYSERLSFRFTYERERSTVYSAERSKKLGYEIGLFDTIYLRCGKYDHIDAEGDRFTYGVGLNVGQNLFDVLSLQSEILRKADIRFDYSRYDEEFLGADAGTSFIGLALSYSFSGD